MFCCDALLFRHAKAVTIVDAHFPFVRGTDAHEASTRTKAGIEQPLCPEHGKRRFIVCIARLLRIRCIRAADVRPLIPVEPEPLQIFHEGTRIFFMTPLFINILDAQHKCPAFLPHLEPCEKGDKDIAQMQKTRRARCKPAAPLPGLFFSLFHHMFVLHQTFRIYTNQRTKIGQTETSITPCVSSAHYTMPTVPLANKTPQKTETPFVMSSYEGCLCCVLCIIS